MTGYPRRTAALAALALLTFLAVSALAVTTPGVARMPIARSASTIRSTAAEQHPSATCVVHSLPSFTAQGEEATAATVADVVEVECNPNVYGTGSKIKITASQLFGRCEGKLTWYVPNPFRVERNRPGVTVGLDADGNATVALLAGPGCAAGESLVAAHMEEEPFQTFTTSFTVLPPHNTTPGVFALPGVQVEDALSSSVATIVQVTFAGGSEKRVHIASEELFARCRRAPHLHWVRMSGAEQQTEEASAVELDNNGNAFVIAIGDGSCAEGPSLIEADLESKPFTTFTTTFTVQPPQPTEEPSFTIEKRQEIMGSGSGFTTSPVTGSIGQTVDYEVLVKNTANVAETFSEFTDTHCDSGTIAGGPGSGTVPPGQSTIYRCDHVLTAVGSYTNEATVTGSSTGGGPLKQTSNQVIATVPPAPKSSNPVEVNVPPTPAPLGTPEAIPGAGPGPSPTPPRIEVGARCEVSRPVLHGASGSKGGVFSVQISSRGVKHITFYLDGRKLKLLKQSQSKGGKFAMAIDPNRLSYGAHKLLVKLVMINPDCASIARSGVFVHPQHGVAPRLAG